MVFSIVGVLKVADKETYVRNWMSYAVMIATALLGFGVSAQFIRLGARIKTVLTNAKIVRLVDKDSKPVDDAKWIGTLLACGLYLGGLLFGFHKSGLMGDAVVGFSAGALVDEVLATGVI